MTEEELAANVVEWLQAEQWEVYQEVETPRANGRADIVAVNGNIVWVVEAKRTFGLSVIAQADSWRWCAHFVSVAVPSQRKRTSGSNFASQICAERGIGIFRVAPKGSRKAWVENKPKLHRKARIRSITDWLVEEHKTYAAAGNAICGYWSPFRSTCDQLRNLVRSGPITVRDAMERIHHHYTSDATARSCMLKWVRDGSVRGVSIDDREKPLRLVAAE